MVLKPDRQLEILPELLRFRHIPIWDPGPEWLRERLDEAALVKLVHLQYDFAKRELQQQLEHLDQQQAIVTEGIKAKR